MLNKATIPAYAPSCRECANSTASHASHTHATPICSPARSWRDPAVERAAAQLAAVTGQSYEEACRLLWHAVAGERQRVTEQEIKAALAALVAEQRKRCRRCAEVHGSKPCRTELRRSRRT